MSALKNALGIWKRAQNGLQRWKDIYENWDLRGLIMISLSLQTFLILAVPIRKRTANSYVVVPIWIAYLLADYVASYAVGLIAKSQIRRNEQVGPFKSPNLLAFWAPFLLVHLGGPDTITAYALQDNELWLRHLFNLLFQTGAALYVFILTLADKNILWLPTLLMFVAGGIKYSERTRSLYLASARRFRESLLTEPDPGPNYGKLMDEYFSMKEAKLPTKIEMIPEPQREPKPEAGGDMKDLEIIKKAYGYFQTFKGLIADLIFSFRERNQSRNFFLKRTARDAFKIVEVELNLFYEILYTKVVVIQNTAGYISRLVSFASIVMALVLFALTNRKNFHGFDVGVTFVLLGGGIFLDILSFLMLLFSDWTAVALSKSENPPWYVSLCRKLLWVNRKRWPKDLEEPPNWFCRAIDAIFYRRWSESIPQYNLVYYCLNQRSKIWAKLIGLVGLTNLFDGIKYVRRKRFNQKLRDFIFEQLQMKSEMADDLETSKEICSARGDWVLRFEGCGHLLNHIMDVDYDESLILWHIATDLCYYTDDDESKRTNEDFRNICKFLSNYMLYLLIMQPTMLSAVAGIGQIRYRDTCAEAMKFFAGRKLGKEDKEKEKKHCCSSFGISGCFCCGKVGGGQDPNANQSVNSMGDQGKKEKGWCRKIFCFWKSDDDEDKSKPNPAHIKACKSIIAVNTEVKPITVKGDRSKSVLFDACILAKELDKLKGNKWEVMSKVWVELLSYAACHCRANTHAAQLSKGGQLISLVWLLMAHLGLGDQFQIRSGHARAKLIVGK